MEETMRDTIVRDDGYADGGEPYTDEESDAINNQVCCETCKKCGEATCGNDVKDLSCYERRWEYMEDESIRLRDADGNGVGWLEVDEIENPQ